jgi:hypothetical protein
MARISTYIANPIPQLDDKLIGTRVTGLPENNTMNFTLQAVFDLFVASGGSSLNIYNSDGTLNGNRFVTMGDYSLSFEKDLIVNTLTIGKGGGNIISNTAFGQNSLYSNTVGATNTSIGYASMYSNITGVDNTSVGSLSLFNNFGGIRNTSLGAYSLYSNIEGSSNVSVGWGSMYWNNEGNYNTSIGVYSLNLNEFGEGNVSIGYRSLVDNVTGSYNVSIGYESMSTNTVAIENISLGSYSLNSLSIGDRNVSIGADSSNYLTLGYYNIGIGYRSLFNLTEGDQNIAIGSNTTLFNDLDSNSIVIGHNAVGIGSNTIVFGNTSITKTILRANVGIGTTNPTFILHVVGSDVSINTLKIGLGGGQVSSNISIGTTSIGESGAGNTGDYLLGIGFRALRFNTTGRANVVYGNEGMSSNTVGSYNTALSIQALLRNTTGNNNTAVGVFSNIWNTTGSNNITIGYASGNSINGTFGLISGDYNIFLGVENYAGITTGSYNVIIGNRVVGLSSSTANNIVIADGQGNIRFRDNGVDTILSRLAGIGTRMVVANAAGELSTQAIGSGSVTGSGTTNYVPKWTSSSDIGNSLIFDDGTNVGIGTTTPSRKLDVNGDVKIGSLLVVDSDTYSSRIIINGILPNTLTYVPFYSNVSPYGEIMRVQNDGNVLIGTTTPNGYKLQVNGTSYFNSDIYVRRPSNNTCYIYVGDATNNYSLLEFRQAINFYTIGTKIGGGFSFTNGFNNNDIFSLSSDATATLLIAGGNKANFSGRVGVGGYSNIYILPNMLTVIGNTSIGTTEALSTANAASVLFSVNSTTQGSIPLPRMTTAQIKAIASPVNGLMAYSTDDFVPCFYDSSVSLWKKLLHSNL